MNLHSYVGGANSHVLSTAQVVLTGLRTCGALGFAFTCGVCCSADIITTQWFPVVCAIAI